MASTTPQKIGSSQDSNPQLDVTHRILSHQEKAARLSPVEEIRTVLAYCTRGELSTFSQVQKHDDYPSGMMVQFACDPNGSPILAVNGLGAHGAHAKDLPINTKCSLLVAKDPEDETDLVITIHGDTVCVSEENIEVVRTCYLAKHPNAFEGNIGNSQFFRIRPKVVKYVSGIAAAPLGSGEFSGEEYSNAEVDPISQFSKPIASHMNRDHAEDTKVIVQYSTTIPVDSAYMLDTDRLGFFVKVTYLGKTYKLRVPFSRPASERKDVKTLIIEMLRAAQSNGN